MADEERNDADKPRVRFGRRVRAENQSSQQGGQAGQQSDAGRKPRHRIGPKHRRGDQAEMALVPPTAGGQPQQPRKEGNPPQGRPKGKGPHRGGNAGQNPSDQGGAKRKRRRRNKGRRNGDESPARPASPSGAPEQDGLEEQAAAIVESAAETLPRQFRPVLPPIEDDLDEIPSGIFEPDDDSDLDSDTDSDVDDDDGDDSEPGQDLSGTDGGDSVATASDASRADAHGPNESRSSRDRKRRKKRRERHDLPPVDRSGGFWWAEQWVRSFEMLFPSNASRSRLAKGRTYARRGQVLELEVGPNGVLARVQGSRPRPYQVRLELNRLRRETWGRILHQLVGKATFLAQLLEGHLPPEIEEVFFSAGARLFPHGDVDVRSRCNCPDPVVPCKHVAALNYALADALQRDPFLLFAMRGKSRDQFLQDLREMRGRDRGNVPPPPVDEDLSDFWRMGRLAESVLRPTGWGMGNDPARLLQSLGEPQLEGIREGLFLPMLEATYRQVAESMRRLPKDA